MGIVRIGHGNHTKKEQDAFSPSGRCDLCVRDQENMRNLVIQPC